MKRILPFLFIAFLLSCSNQQSENSDTVEQEDYQVLSPTEADSDGEKRPTLTVDKPESLATIQTPDENSTKGGNTEVSFMFQKATTAYSNNDFETGINLFNKIIALEPDNRKAYYNLGIGYFEMDKYHDALKAYNNAIALSPDDSPSILQRGRVYYMLGDFRSCLRDYEHVLTLKPEDPEAWYNRGTAKGQLKDFLGAIQDFDKAIELRPDYAEAFFNRGLANYFQRRLHEACYDWRKAHSLGHYEADKALRIYCEGGE
jgi:tetratricopeptide (TPR) repeat protein